MFHKHSKPSTMDDKNKLQICKKYIVCFALSTRLAAITLQFISNILIIDHKSDAFQSPKDHVNLTLFDKITNTFLGGLLQWDAQYFHHIVKYGYTYENTLAFFPLYPILNKLLNVPVSYIFPFLDGDSINLIIFVCLNLLFFVKASLALFDLSVLILNRKLAYKATILFCINPATIFFIAPYTESLFSYVTFTAMHNCADVYYKSAKNKAFANCANMLSISVPVALSIATRSNGLLNIGFMVYYWLLFFRKTYWPHNIATCMNLIKYSLMLCVNVAVCLVPFVAIQMYAYQNFCTNFDHNLPKNIVQFANENELVLPGTFAKHNQTWCFSRLPLAYAYVQEHYWNVGFLKYYQFVQIPNFLLALPVVLIVLGKSALFFRQHTNYCLNLGIFEFNVMPIVKYDSTYDQKMFVFVCHAVFLTIFSVLCIHVQVTTRILCSASPVLYWFCAYIFDSINTDFEMFTSWKGFLLNEDLSRKQKLIKYYFLSYFILGTVLFSNNFPWT